MLIHRDYPCHRDNYQGKRTQKVAYLVYHYVGALGDAQQNAAYYGTTPGIKASAHYFVGHAEDGADVWASVPEDCVASHCGRTDGKYKHPTCRNANSIGIELCCHQRADGTWYFDQATIDRGVELGRDIMARYGIDADHVLRHYDVTGKTCPAPFVLDVAEWETFKGRLAAQEGEIDMTKEEVQALVDAAVEAAAPKVYAALVEVPKWAQGLVGRAMDAGFIKGDGTGKLNLTDQDLKTLSMLGAAGLMKGSV